MMLDQRDKQRSVGSLSLLIACKALNGSKSGFIAHELLCQLCETHSITLVCLSLAQIPQECAFVNSSERVTMSVWVRAY